MVAAGLALPTLAQQEFTLEIGPNEDLRVSYFSLWLPTVDPADSLRGLLAVSDWQAGREVYDDSRFRAWAMEERFALLRYEMRNWDASLFLAKEPAAVDRLFNEALPSLAASAQRPELDDVNVIFTGLSQGGWQSVALADLAPQRAIATLPIHDSTGARAPQQAQVATGLGVPALHLIGERDNINGGSLDQGNTYPQTINDFVITRRAAGALVAAAIQPGTGHTDWEGNEPHSVPFMLDWLSAVVARRVANDPTLPPIPLTDLDGFAGSQLLEFNAAQPWVEVLDADVESFGPLSPAQRAERLWLPGAAFAQQWEHYQLTGEYIPAVPGPVGAAVLLVLLIPSISRRA